MAIMPTVRTISLSEEEKDKRLFFKNYSETLRRHALTHTPNAPVVFDGNFSRPSIPDGRGEFDEFSEHGHLDPTGLSIRGYVALPTHLEDYVPRRDVDHIVRAVAARIPPEPLGVLEMYYNARPEPVTPRYERTWTGHEVIGPGHGPRVVYQLEDPLTRADHPTGSVTVSFETNTPPTMENLNQHKRAVETHLFASGWAWNALTTKLKRAEIELKRFLDEMNPAMVNPRNL